MGVLDYDTHQSESLAGVAALKAFRLIWIMHFLCY